MPDMVGLPDCSSWKALEGIGPIRQCPVGFKSGLFCKQWLWQRLRRPRLPAPSVASPPLTPPSWDPLFSPRTLNPLQVIYKIYEPAEMAPLIETANAEKAAAASS